MATDFRCFPPSQSLLDQLRNAASQLLHEAETRHLTRFGRWLDKYL